MTIFLGRTLQSSPLDDPIFVNIFAQGKWPLFDCRMNLQLLLYPFFYPQLNLFQFDKWIKYSKIVSVLM